LQIVAIVIIVYTIFNNNSSPTREILSYEST